MENIEICLQKNRGVGAQLFIGSQQIRNSYILPRFFMKSGSQKLRGQIVFKFFKVVEKIGNGGFGEIFLVTHLTRQESYALKIQPQSALHPLIPTQFKLYKYLHQEKQQPGIPRVYLTAVDRGYNMMLMELLGKNLDQLLALQGGKFSTKTVLMIGIQLISRIKFIHDKGYLHRDIKPDNLLMGVGEKSKELFIIDMGLSKQYMVKQKHIAYRQGREMTGTVRYASISTQKGIEQTRRDDIETIGYVLLYFLRGNLPWQNIKAATAKAKFEMIKMKKMKTSLEQLCQGCPSEFIELISYARSLKFEDEPDYDFINSLLRKAAEGNEIEIDQKYDWDTE